MRSFRRGTIPLRLSVIPLLFAVDVFVFATDLPPQLLTTNTAPAPAQPPPDKHADARATIAFFHDTWAKEHDPVKRSILAGQVVDAVIHDFDEQPVEIADEVVRDGAPKNELVVPDRANTVTLDPLATLKDAHWTELDYPPSPVFRRISQHRVEAWTSQEGWLFNERGKIVADVHVPRRDGGGKEWFGAFLPNGMWITTDLWANDEQLNCYNSKGKWLWELPGDTMLAHLPKDTNPNSPGEPITPSIGWARADHTGRRWLVCLGTDYMRGCALVGPNRHFQGLLWPENLWADVYPRAMGVRGTYTVLLIKSDDGEESIHRDEPAHGMDVGWPTYLLPGNRSVIVNSGNRYFGFWPHSHSTYIETGRRWEEPNEVWFFDANGKYEGQIAGSYLADSANGGNLLIQDARGSVVEVTHGKTGLTIASVRKFQWPDGTMAVPLAIYDDLGFGFFLRGPGTIGLDDQARRSRGNAEIVLGKWG